MDNRRSKEFKLRMRMEGLRLAKAFKSVGEWTDELSDRCEEAANKILGVSQGSKDKDLRAETWKKESPCGFDITCLSPAVRMCPC